MEFSVSSYGTACSMTIIMSRTGFAARPGIDVLPTCSIVMKGASNNFRSCSRSLAMLSNCCGQSGL